MHCRQHEDRMALIAFAEGVVQHGSLPSYEEALRQDGTTSSGDPRVSSTRIITTRTANGHTTVPVPASHRYYTTQYGIHIQGYGIKVGKHWI